MAITSISSQTTSTTMIQSQEQQLLNQIKNLQNKNAKGNDAQIKVLQQQYNALVLQQTQDVSSQAVIPQQKASMTIPAAPSSLPAAGQVIDIKA